MSADRPSLGTKGGVFAPLIKLYFLNSLVRCIFDTNDNICHFTERSGRVCLLFEGPCIFVFLTHCVGLVSHIHVCNFNNQESPAVGVFSQTQPTTEPAFHISPSVQSVAAAAHDFGKTTVRPPGHRWTGTNHQSEWLLTGLEQLPQTY